MAPPILLLKTKSNPHDAYAEFFSTHGYNPLFIPVLEHNFNERNLETVQRLFETGELDPGPGRKYGGLIFTSQRAVEGFARVLGGVGAQKTTQASHSLPLYTVGPATSRSLQSLCETHLPHASIHGSDTGNGENLSKFILEHYNHHQHQQQQHNAREGESRRGRGKLPLLFLVGEQRRDIIPKALMDENRPLEERIGVEEMVVYETGVKGEFEGGFRDAVNDGYQYLSGDSTGEKTMWVVVFSPTGCDAMLRVLSLGSQASNPSPSLNPDPENGDKERRVFVATIGPTTREHLRSKFGFEPDVCAEKPSQDGVGVGIERFMEGWRNRRGNSSS